MGWRQAGIVLTLMWVLPLCCEFDKNGMIHDEWGSFGSEREEHDYFFDGTVLKVYENKKQMLVEITDSKWSHFTDREQVLVDYEEYGDVVLEISAKEGMYVSITYWEEQLKPRQNGIACLEAYGVEKHIAFVNGKWSEGTYD